MKKCKMCKNKGVWQDIINNNWFCTKHYINILVGDLIDIGRDGSLAKPLLLVNS